MKTTDHNLIVTRFVSMPKIITGPGKYVTRCGETVEIFHVADRRASCGWHRAWGEYNDDNKTKECWEVSGCIFPSIQSDNDIMRAA